MRVLYKNFPLPQAPAIFPSFLGDSRGVSGHFGGKVPERTGKKEMVCKENTFYGVLGVSPK
jgi:hypothetical protein